MRSFLPAFLLLWSGPVLAADANPLTYEEHVRPIFRAHCFDCHGAAEKLEGSLDLRLVRFLKKGGDSGPALVPGQPQDSYLLERLKSGEMPPGETKVSPEEIKTIQDWIAAGARAARPEPETLGPGLGITAEERAFWAFQPIKRPAVPELSSFPEEARVRTAIDALVLDAAPQSSKPAFAPEADRRTLVKRAYFDLIGLPPAPEEMENWLSDPSPDWYDRLLTELLDSPHYGERWGRHWLDVAGYADSEGYTVADAERPWAWKYRDWVIRALNEDKPFDRFITEQLAGDELAGPIQGDLTAEQIDLLTATGFLRMAADGTGSGANTPEARHQVMTDTLKIVGTSLLAMSVQCAACHDHRYDPIPQTDYYALRAVFEPALDWKAWKVPNARLVSLYTASDRKQAAEIEAEAQKIAAEKATKQAEFMRQALEKELLKYEEPLRAQLRDAYQIVNDKRSEEQKLLLAKHPSVNIRPGVLYQYLPKAAEDLKKFDQQMSETRAKKPKEEFLRALVEPANHVPPTNLFHRGDFQQPKQAVAPAGLSVTSPAGEHREFSLNDEALPTTGRRLAFAQWLTNRQNPLFARVIVNRTWMHHFGTGLVATPADFGKLGATPSDPELLDWLADEFIREGWSLKKLHRLILTSTTWRQTNEVRNAEWGMRNEDTSALRSLRTQIIPHSAFPISLRRLEAETIRDRMLAVTGQLDRTLHGPPLSVKEDETGQVVVEGGQTRRSLYVKSRRSRPVAMLQAFDAPVMETNCESRSSSTVATQSLMLLNGEFILDQAAKLADRAAQDAKPLSQERLALLPKPPEPRGFGWQWGYGQFDEAKHRTGEFTPLPHWTGSQWQGGAKLPDAKLGWALLHAQGGHPDVAARSVIRRWTAPADGTLSITGTLSHASASGDGVRGRVVSSRSGIAAELTAHNGKADFSVGTLEIQAGETIDFITDCRANHNADSFTWPVTITLKVANQPDQIFSSAEQFRGPVKTDDSTALPAQINRAWELALCREPSIEELTLAMNFIAGQFETFLQSPEAVPKDRTPARQALTNLCQALLSSNEFLYVE